jgi:hypothetical protein
MCWRSRKNVDYDQLIMFCVLTHDEREKARSEAGPLLFHVEPSAFLYGRA